MKKVGSQSELLLGQAAKPLIVWIQSWYVGNHRQIFLNR